MNTLLWILQFLAAFAFLYSGISKLSFSEQKLIAMGQTGVEGFSPGFIRLIGSSELVGALGIILPWLLGVYEILTPVAAICLAIIMPFAAIIHYRRKEFPSVAVNIFLFLVCAVVAVGRLREILAQDPG